MLCESQGSEILPAAEPPCRERKVHEMGRTGSPFDLAAVREPTGKARDPSVVLVAYLERYAATRRSSPTSLREPLHRPGFPSSERPRLALEPAST